MNDVGVIIGVASLALTVIVGVLGVLLSVTARHPTLRAGGSVGSRGVISGREIQTASIRIRNEGTVWGIRARRDPAVIANARLRDPTNNQFVGPLLWWRKDGGALDHRCVIEGGREAELIVFAKEAFSQEFFVFDAPDGAGPLAPYLLTFSEHSKDFVVVITDDLGNSTEIPVAAHNHQQIHVHVKPTWSARIRVFKQGNREAWRALTMRP